tara:strand:+ start:243 stop:581 length:339 start_codon:yes stop_codon:yes gene_type:complete
MSSLIEAYRGELNKTKELLAIERERGVELEKLKSEMSDLKAANEKFESDLSYAIDMLQSYKLELNKTKELLEVSRSTVGLYKEKSKQYSKSAAYEMKMKNAYIKSYREISCK